MYGVDCVMLYMHETQGQALIVHNLLKNAFSS